MASRSVEVQPNRLWPLVRALYAWWDWKSFDYRRLWTPRFIGSCSPKVAALLLLICRGMLALHSLWVIVYNRGFWHRFDDDKFFSYATLQGGFLVTSYLLCSVVVGTVVWHARRSPGSTLATHLAAGTTSTHASASHLFIPPLLDHPCLSVLWTALLQATQLLWCTALTWQIVIVAVYWNSDSPVSYTEEGVWLNYEHHGVKLAIMWADFLLLGSNRLVDRHCLVVLLCAVAYILWNIDYTLRREPVYWQVNWRDAQGSAYVVLPCLLLLVLAYYVAMPLAMLRDRLASCVNGVDAHLLAPCACCAGQAQEAEEEDACDEQGQASKATGGAHSLGGSSTWAHAVAVSHPLYPYVFTDEQGALPFYRCRGRGAATRMRCCALDASRHAQPASLPEPSGVYPADSPISSESQACEELAVHVVVGAGKAARRQDGTTG